VIEEIIKAQYSSFIAVASKVASVHDATSKAKEAFHSLQEKKLNEGPFSRQNLGSSTKDGYAQMASYLVPSLQQSQVQQPQVGGSLFGKSTTGTSGGFAGAFATQQSTIPTSTPFGAKPATSLFGASTAASAGGGLFGSVQTKRSNSTGP
jgi:hypothetical protein